MSRKAAHKEGKARKAAGDDVSRAFKEAQAGADAEERRRVQSATLEALFEALFRVLKHASSSGLLGLGRPGVHQASLIATMHALMHPACCALWFMLGSADASPSNTLLNSCPAVSE